MRQLDELKDVKGAPARYVDATGDTMSGNLNFTIDASLPLNIDFGKTTSTWARGLTFKKNGLVYGSYGAYGSTDGVSFLYLTLGDSYYNANSGLAIYPNDIKFKGTSLSLNGHTHDTLSTRDEVGGFNKTLGGFKRPNGTLNGYNDGLAIHVTHPSYKNGEYSRGISFSYGDSLTLATYAYNKDGSYAGRAKIYTSADKPTPDEIGAASMNNVSMMPEANKIVQRDAQGDVRARLLATTYGDDNYMRGALAFRVNNTGDSVTRYCNNPAAVRGWLNSVCKAGDNITGTLQFNCSGNEIEIQSSNSTLQARGVVFKNSSNGITGMIGSLMNTSSVDKVFMGATDSPWTGANSLTVTKGGAYFNNSKLISVADCGQWSFSNRDLTVYNKRALVGYNNTDGNKLVVNYNSDFASVEISGKVTIDGLPFGALASNSFRNCIPIVGGDGVMEIGSIIDFHCDGSNADYHSRLQCYGNRDLRVTGNFTASDGSLMAYGYSKRAIIGTGGSDIYLCNDKSQKYLQLKDDGRLCYSDTPIQLAPQSSPLWSGCTYLNKGQNFTVSKSIRDCQNGWVLVFSDYDVGGNANGNNWNYTTHVIHKNSLVVNSGNVLFSIPNSESGGWTIKAAYIKDREIQGQSDQIDGWNDVVLRQILEW